MSIPSQFSNCSTVYYSWILGMLPHLNFSKLSKIFKFTSGVVYISAALKYYPAVLLPTGPIGFSILNANIPLAEHSINTIVNSLLCRKIFIIQIIVYDLYPAYPGCPARYYFNSICIWLEIQPGITMHFKLKF